jgi:hypothetical protein
MPCEKCFCRRLSLSFEKNQGDDLQWRGKNSGDGIDLVASLTLQNIDSGDFSFRGTGWFWGAFLKEE